MYACVCVYHKWTVYPDRAAFQRAQAPRDHAKVRPTNTFSFLLRYTVLRKDEHFLKHPENAAVGLICVPAFFFLRMEEVAVYLHSWKSVPLTVSTELPAGSTAHQNGSREHLNSPHVTKFLLDQIPLYPERPQAQLGKIQLSALLSSLWRKVCNGKLHFKCCIWLLSVELLFSFE